MPHLTTALATLLVAGGWLGIHATRVAPPAPPVAPLEVAITVDDLTRPPFDAPLDAPEHVLARLTEAFARHHLPPVMGFVNGATVQDRPGEREALAAWLRSGNRLGNHTWGHVDLAKVGVAGFMADVERNEPLLTALAGPAGPGQGWRVFRFPFLQEGATVEAREAVRKQLFARGYRIAEVTVDFEDWRWSPAFARCSGTEDLKGIEELRTLYRNAAREALLDADKTAHALFGRRIRQVVLIHAEAFTAEMIEPLLQEYEALGVRFVSLDDALADPVYHVDPRVARSWGSPFLVQVELARHGDLPLVESPEHAELLAVCHSSSR
jgi:peptidoglycan/xylan/chitin deacetylase (PgdA/CDA1 family)